MSGLQERSSWNVKDTAVLTELIALMNLNDEEAALLASVKPKAEESVQQMTTAFYDRLFAHENTKEYFEGKSMERLHGMISTWFVELFSGTYDEAYAKRRMVIGAIHVKIGLPVRYPLAMIDVIMPFGENIARQSADPEKGANAFRKVLSLDVAIFNQAYEDNQLQHLSELVGGERLARLLLAGTG